MMNSLACKLNKIFLITALFTFLSIGVAFASTKIPAEVLSVNDPIKNNGTSYTQEVLLRFPSGEQLRTERIIFTYPNDYIKVPLKQGDRVSVLIDSSASSKYQITGYDRVNDLLWLPAIFIAAYIIILGAKNLSRLLLQFGIVVFALLALYLGIMINAPSILTLLAIITGCIIYFFMRFKGHTLTLISGLSVSISMLVLYIFSFFLIGLLKLQDGIVGPLLSFYNYSTNIDSDNLTIACILIASIGGVLAVVAYEVKEGVAQKSQDKNIPRNKLITKSARAGIRILREKTYAFMTLIIGLITLFVAPFLSATSISNTLNTDPISNIIGFLFLVLLGWLLTVPITAVIVGLILGRVQTHKLVTSETLDEFEGFI